MSNRLLTVSEAGALLWDGLQKALDEAGIDDEDRPKVALEALSALNRSLGGPGIEECA